MPYVLPADVDERPIVIDGAGTLGRRIAAVYVGGGSDVRIFDLSAEQRQAARDYVEENLVQTQQMLGLHPDRAGRIEVSDDLQEAVAGGWMVIEAVPERTDIKTEVFGDLERLAEPDAILCSNSSSIPTSQIIGKVEHPERVLNTHYQQPPELNAVELMSCGKTDQGIIDALMEKFPHYGLVPFWVRRESDGFIFNRIWAAIKRECLMVVEEGVAPPEDVDALWEIYRRKYDAAKTLEGFSLKLRDGPGRIKGRRGSGSEGDDAACPRLLVVALRDSSEGSTDRLATLVFSEDSHSASPRVNWRSVKGLEWVAKSSWPILLPARPAKDPLPVSRKESQ